MGCCELHQTDHISLWISLKERNRNKKWNTWGLFPPLPKVYKASKWNWFPWSTQSTQSWVKITLWEAANRFSCLGYNDISQLFFHILHATKVLKFWPGIFRTQEKGSLTWSNAHNWGALSFLHFLHVMRSISNKKNPWKQPRLGF